MIWSKIRHHVSYIKILKIKEIMSMSELRFMCMYIYNSIYTKLLRELLEVHTTKNMARYRRVRRGFYWHNSKQKIIGKYPTKNGNKKYLFCSIVYLSSSSLFFIIFYILVATLSIFPAYIGNVFDIIKNDDNNTKLYTFCNLISEQS